MCHKSHNAKLSKYFKKFSKVVTVARFIVGIGFIMFTERPGNAYATGYTEPTETYSSVNYTTPGKRKHPEPERDQNNDTSFGGINGNNINEAVYHSPPRNLVRLHHTPYVPTYHMPPSRSGSPNLYNRPAQGHLNPAFFSQAHPFQKSVPTGISTVLASQHSSHINQHQAPTMGLSSEQILFPQNGVQTMGHILTQNSMGLGLLNSATQTPVSNSDSDKFRPRRGRKNVPRKITINLSPYASAVEAFTTIPQEELTKLNLNSDSVIHTRVMDWRYPNYFLGHINVNGELPEKFQFPVMAKRVVSGPPPIWLDGIKFMSVADAYAKLNISQNEPFPKEEILFRLKSIAHPNDYYDYLDKAWFARNSAVLPQLNEYELKEYRCKQRAQWETRLSGNASFSAPPFINPVFNNSSNRAKFVPAIAQTFGQISSFSSNLTLDGSSNQAVPSDPFIVNHFHQPQLQPVASDESAQIQTEPLPTMAQIMEGSSNENTFDSFSEQEWLDFFAEMDAAWACSHNPSSTSNIHEAQLQPVALDESAQIQQQPLPPVASDDLSNESVPSDSFTKSEVFKLFAEIAAECAQTPEITVAAGGSAQSQQAQTEPVAQIIGGSLNQNQNIASFVSTLRPEQWLNVFAKTPPTNIIDLTGDDD